MKTPIPKKACLLTTAITVIGSLATAQAGIFSADFNDGAVPANSAVYGVANVQPSGGYTNSGYLQIVTAAAGATGVYIITSDLDAGTPVVAFTADFKMTIGGGSGAGDGFSINLATDLDLTGNWGTPEDGNGTGLSVTFDTYPNGAPDTAPAIGVRVGGTEIATAFAPQLVTGTGNYVDVRIQLNPDKTLTVVYDGVYAYTNLDLSAYLTPSIYPFTGAYFGIGARNGSATANVFLDDLAIVTRTNGVPFVRSYYPVGRWTQPASAIDITLTNATTSVNSGSIVLQLDGATVAPTITPSGGTTTIHFAPAGGFGSYSSHSVKLAFADNASPTPNTSILQYQFSIPATSYITYLTDGFESYTAGGVPLDMDYPSGANAAPNGGPGNPWFGPAPPNLRVVTTEGGVVPHGGTKMTRGSAASDLDQDWVNITYRFNKGGTYTGNIMMDWWFYDPLGAVPAGTNYAEFGAIGYYNTAPTTTDYPVYGDGTHDGSLNYTAAQIQRLCLGASSVQTVGGFDGNKYQTRVVGAGDGYSAGWFNLPGSRSVGWHHGRVVVGPSVGLVAGGTVNYVEFFLDDMSTPIFQHVDRLAYGYNVLELNQAYKATFGYMDDVSFAVGRPPNITAAFSSPNVTLTWPGSDFVLQSASDAVGPYTDVTDATSGYMWDVSAVPQQFFRLRNK